MPLLGVHLGWTRRLIDSAGGHGGSGSLEGAVDRGDTGVEQLGDLVGVPAEHLPQDQHRPLARRQVLEGGDEGKTDGLPGGGELGRVAVGR